MVSDEIQVESFTPRRRLVVEQLFSSSLRRPRRECLLIVCEKKLIGVANDKLLSNVSIAAVQMYQKNDAATSTEVPRFLWKRTRRHTERTQGLLHPVGPYHCPSVPLPLC